MPALPVEPQLDEGAAIQALIERLGADWIADRVREVRASGVYWVRGGRRHPVPEVLALGPYPETPSNELVRQHEALSRLAFIARDVTRTWELLVATHRNETALLNELHRRDGFEAVAFEAFVAAMLIAAGNDVQPSPASDVPTPEFLVPVGQSVIAVECKVRLPDDRTAQFLRSVEEVAQALAQRGRGVWTVQFDCDVAISEDHAARATRLLVGAAQQSIDVNEVIDGSVWVRARPQRSRLLEHQRPGPLMEDIDIAVVGVRERADVTVYARRTAEWPRLRIEDALNEADDQLRGCSHGLLCVGPASSVWQPLAARGAYLNAAKRELDALEGRFARTPHITAVALFARGISCEPGGACAEDLVLLTGLNPAHQTPLPDGFRLVPEDAVLEYVPEGTM